MQLTYRPEIDGLRALAVVPVILYHANFDLFSGGFVGVDVFFVISGYLIASIILAEMRERRFSFASFYERRIRRIMPALLTVILTTLIFLPLVALPDQIVDAAKSSLFAIFGISNFFFWSESGYFSPATEFMPFLHSWSLGVEEQFYIFLPPILLLLLRFKVKLRWAIGLALPVMFAVSLWMSANMAAAAFYLLPARAWELGLGVALAAGVFPAIRNQAAANGLAWAGIAAILASTILINDTMIFPGWVALLPCIGTGLLIYAGSSENSAGKFLSLQPLRYIGLLSYSLYLWHWPIFVFLRYMTASAELSPLIACVGIALAFSMSAATYHWIETPFRSRTKMPFKTAGSYVGGATAVAAFLAATSIGYGGFPGRLNDTSKQFLAASTDFDQYRFACVGLEAMSTGNGECRFGDPTAPISFVVVGDSHAAAIRPAFDAWAKQNGRAGILTWRGACALLKDARQTPDWDSDECDAFKQAFFQKMADDPDVTDVFLAGRWSAAYSGYLPESGGSRRTYLVDEENASLTVESTKLVFGRAVRRTISALNESGKRVSIIGSVPETGFDVPRILALAEFNGVNKEVRATVHAEETTTATELDEIFGHAAHTFKGTRYIPLRQKFCKPQCQLIQNGISLYRDDDHITATAARDLIGPYLANQLSNSK